MLHARVRARGPLVWYKKSISHIRYFKVHSIGRAESSRPSLEILNAGISFEIDSGQK